MTGVQTCALPIYVCVEGGRFTPRDQEQLCRGEGVRGQDEESDEVDLEARRWVWGRSTGVEEGAEESAGAGEGAQEGVEETLGGLGGFGGVVWVSRNSIQS